MSVPVSGYEFERDVYRGSKLGFLELPGFFQPAPPPSRWSRFRTGITKFLDRLVEIANFVD